MKINNKILETIKSDKVLRDKLAKTMNKSPHTIYLWMWGNSDNLTKMEALKCISEHTQISVDNLISE